MKNRKIFILLFFLLNSCQTADKISPIFISTTVSNTNVFLESLASLPNQTEDIKLNNIKSKWPAILTDFLVKQPDMLIDPDFWLRSDIKKWQQLVPLIKNSSSLKMTFYLKNIRLSTTHLSEKKVASVIEAQILMSYGLRDEALTLFKLGHSIIPDSLIALKIAEIEYFNNLDPKESYKYFLQIEKEKLITERHFSIFSLLKSKLLSQKIDFSHIGLTDDNISALAIDGDDIWVGTWNGSVIRYNSNSFESAMIIKGAYEKTVNAVKSFSIDKFSVYIGMSQLVYRFSKRTENLLLVSPTEGKTLDRVQKLYGLASGEILIGTLGQGLWITQGDQLIQTCKNLPSQYINEIKEENGQIFIGTMDRGLFQWDFDNDQIIQTQSKGSINFPTNITYLNIDQARIWIGTYGAGLYIYDRESHFLEKIQFGNSNKWILAGTESNENIYIGSLGEGLLIFNKKNKIWSRWDLSNGGPSDISAMIYSNPYLAIGTLGDGLQLVIEGLSEKSLF